MRMQIFTIQKLNVYLKEQSIWVYKNILQYKW